LKSSIGDSECFVNFTRERSFVAKATLLVVQGVDQGARFEIGDESVSVGRGVRNGVRILDTEVSRQHATIHFSDGLYWITDCHSSNGTFVNGVSVRSCELTNGDQIQIGCSVVLFRLPVDDGSKYVADKIDLVGRSHTDDRSSIVGEVSQDVGRTLLGATSPGVSESQALSQSLANLQALYRVSEEAVSPSISLDQLLTRILDLTIEVVGADRGCMLVDDPQTGTLVPQVFSHGRGVDASEKMPVSRSIVDYVLKQRQGVRTSDARRDRRFEPGQSILQAGICEAMCVPMQGRYQLMGAVYVDTTTPPEHVILEGETANKFTEEQLRLLVAIGRQSALAIENNRYQQALLKAERLAAMGQTIAMLSHHIKNILQGMRGGSYLIDIGLNDQNEDLVRKGWGIVEKNQNKIYHLVMDMLTFSKERQPALEAASLNETVAEVCELMQARSQECQVTFESQLAPDLPVTTFDTEGIHRAVLNIVTNAIDAVEGMDDPAVSVKTGYDPQSDAVFVVVVDNGPGISEDQLSRIFNVFESTKGARGTGLGLAVSQKIILEHGGEITVESKPGQGSQFVLCWPRTDEEHRHLETEAGAEGP
jgi:signal transduction histidine kinase/pSer/pThr/pTyr-binding forkhead associated (FHA) protein